MTLPIVVEHRARSIRPAVPNECLCVEHGAIRPIFRIPRRHVCTGLKPMIYAAAYLHAGKKWPAVINEPVQFVEFVQ